MDLRSPCGRLSRALPWRGGGAAAAQETRGSSVAYGNGGRKFRARPLAAAADPAEIFNSIAGIADDEP
jgi:hypothetical protein